MSYTEARQSQDWTYFVAWTTVIAVAIFVFASTVRGFR